MDRLQREILADLNRPGYLTRAERMLLESGVPLGSMTDAEADAARALPADVYREIGDTGIRVGDLLPLVGSYLGAEDTAKAQASGDTFGTTLGILGMLPGAGAITKGFNPSKVRGWINERNPISRRIMGMIYDEVPEPEIPTDTRESFKLMRLMKNQPGLVYPLYARATVPGKAQKQAQGFVGGTWHGAVAQRPQIGAEPLAYRPGIHAVNHPVFDQGKGYVKGQQRAWVASDMPSISPATQLEADTSPVLDNGMRAGITNRLIGPRESYDYRTNPSSSTDADGWPIAGSMRPSRIVSDDETAERLRAAGLEHQIDNSMTRIDMPTADKLNEELRVLAEFFAELRGR